MLDFTDFMNCVAEAGAKVITPSHTNFKLFEGQSSAPKLRREGRPKLCQIRLTQFRRGSKVVYYKTVFGQEKFLEFNYLRVKHSMDTPDSLQQPDGRPKAKNLDIIKN